jgi:Short C-terminal domain
VPVVIQGGSGGSVADEVRKLTELREQGVLSEEEYAAAKQRALLGGTA